MKSLTPYTGLAVLVVLIVGVGGAYYLFKPVTDTPAPVTELPGGPQQNVPGEEPVVEDTLGSPFDHKTYWDKRVALQASLTPYTVEATFLPEPMQVAHPRRDSYEKLYKVGAITNGALAGETLYVEEAGEMGVTYTRSIVRDGVVVGLDDAEFLFSYEVQTPYEIQVPGTPYTMRRAESGRFLFIGDQYAKPLFSLGANSTFSRINNNQCIMTELPDHVGLAYDLDIPFVNEDNGKLTIKLSDGTFFEDEYSFFDYGCGAGCRLFAYAPGELAATSSRLSVVGNDVSTGDPVYALASESDPFLKALYEDKNTVAYYRPDQDWTHEPESKYTYSQFLSHRPLLYWKDPWGKLVQFRNKRFESAAEKCKPVIYLYPEKEGEFHVEVAPNGGFTKTIPEYGDGWDVRAVPDGTLTDLDTGVEYPYLYWSGMGLSYPEITSGWVVAREDVDAFFDEKLYALGLEGNEIADFKEYWVPRLSEDAFYKISFLSPRDFDKMAPLSVAPQKPDTTIRVMMTAQVAEKGTTLPLQVLPPRPERNGFVLVEWGGTLLY